MSEETGVADWVRREYTGVAELRGPLLVVRGDQVLDGASASSPS